ncbi:hypothetical protein ACFY84_15565 [Streptomyces sp. NPDC012438]|uniref:plasmid mobilization protein n=1 Tax=Streptomyces sp. NPDC012438 TaxID=3364833 RepID=UPI0036F158CB
MSATPLCSDSGAGRPLPTVVSSLPPHGSADDNSVSGGASWGGSKASAVPAPEGAGEDLHQGAQVLEASTGGGSEPGNEEKPKPRRRERRVRQRPRQPPAKKRRHQPSTRFNDDEYALVVAAAAQCNLTVAGFLARSALAAARDLDRTSAEIATERDMLTALFDSRRKLGWAGSNLNQVTKALNAGADAAVPQLEASLAAVRRAADAVHAAATAVLERQQAA